MTLKRIALPPGVNQESTRYSNEGQWWVTDKVRFRSGFPEKIGGYQRLSDYTFQGICRALIAWTSLGGAQNVGVGTNLKYYVESGGMYYDITPLRSSVSLTDPFTATNGSTVLTVSDVAHGASAGDFVTFSGATGLGGTVTATVLNTEFQITTVIDADSYTVALSVAANATDAAGSPGGGTVGTAYQIGVGAATQVPVEGWGVGAWGVGAWGVGSSDFVQLRLWSHSNFGEDLIYCPRGEPLYYWDFSGGYGTRGVPVTGLVGANEVPVAVNSVLVSDVSRFVLAFGCNGVFTTTLDPMLIRWSDQESMVDWMPAATNQAGSLRLSRGSEIVAQAQMRQEIMVWTDSALYSLQYQGAPIGWGAQLLGENISIAGPNAVAVAGGAAYWMGVDKFYAYNGQAAPLPSTLKRHVFSDINQDQLLQVVAGTLEAFNEIWWFYPSANSTVPDKYVVFNYVDNIWYMGNMTRYAWLDSGLLTNPMAAIEDKLVLQEIGNDDNTTDTTAPIEAYIESAEFDLDDGDKFSFVYRIMPDVTFTGSTATSPSLTLTLYPMTSSGSGMGNSVGGSRSGTVTRSVAVPVEEFTEQVYIRVRGRQLVLRVESSGLGTAWQLGTPRIDLKPDGRRA